MTDIWDQWTEHYHRLNIDPARICRDGIIDEHLFEKARRRILFVMKETDDFRGDLREFLKDGPKTQMWHATARWAAGLLGDFPPFDKIDNEQAMRKSLTSIATINLKKASGGAQADMQKVNAYAQQDQNLLRRQISLIKPDVIVACGTFDIMIWLLGLKVDCDDPKKKAVFHEDMVIIPWKHPGRVPNRKSYEQLGELWRKRHNDS